MYIIYYNLHEHHEPSNPGWFHPIFPSLSPEACNARICGAYHLVGVREGRPLYLLPGKKAVIRYAPESDRPSMGPFCWGSSKVINKLVKLKYDQFEVSTNLY